MPYTIVKRNNRFCVHKKNADGSVGERIACHDTKQSAIDQIGAIESSEKAIKEQDLEILMVQSETLLNLMYALVWADRLDDAAQVVSRITEQNEKIRGLIYLAERYGYRDDKETSTRYYAEAKQLILKRWEDTLYTKVNEHLVQNSRDLRAALEKLWDKYDQPLHRILQERDNAAAELSKYLKELGYE